MRLNQHDDQFYIGEVCKKEHKPHGRGFLANLKYGLICLGQFKLGESQTKCDLVGDFVIQRDSVIASQKMLRD